MNLYEATDGRMGYAYVRAYVWARSEEEAYKLAFDAFWADCDEFGRERLRESLKLELLFQEDASPFCTCPSDTGWDWTKSVPPFLKALSE